MNDRHYSKVVSDITNIKDTKLRIKTISQIFNFHYLERNTTISVFIDDIKHFLHENRIRTHSKRTRKFAFRKRRPHHGNDFTAVAILGSSPPFTRS